MDTKLVIQAKKHDKEAFVKLIEDNQASMYKAAIAILQNDEDAADAIQETILQQLCRMTFANKKLQKTLWGNKYNSRKDMDKWFRKIVIPQSMRTKPINRKVSDYQETSDEYSTCVYEGGKLFLYELWKAMGDKTFFEMLQKYYQTYQFRLATTEDFLIMVRAVGKDEKVEQIIERYVE